MYTVKYIMCVGELTMLGLKLCADKSVLPTFETFRVYVGRLKKKRLELLRNKKPEELRLLLNQPFCMQKKTITQVEVQHTQSHQEPRNFELDVLQKVNKKNRRTNYKTE